MSARGAAAVVVTSDTGSHRVRTWRAEETAWFPGRSDGRWRMVAMVVRDVQLPAALGGPPQP
jgi:hypothetical protein